MTAWTRATHVEGMRVAVGTFTAVTSRDTVAALDLLDDASPDELRSAVYSLAGVLAGMVVGLAMERGVDPTDALEQAALGFGEGSRYVVDGGGPRG